MSRFLVAPALGTGATYFSFFTNFEDVLPPVPVPHKVNVS
jgi:hypothetical protein